MRVLIFEHVCGGALAGCGGTQTLGELAPAGKAMWLAAIHDFILAGCEVVTTIDHRMAHDAPPCETSVIESASELDTTLESLAATCDAALIIAPEEGGALAHWAARLIPHVRHWLGCSLAAIELCGDKHRLAEHLRARDIPTPRTWQYGEQPGGATESRARAVEWIVKPRFGAGCEGTRVIPANGDMRRKETDDDLIAQPYLHGLSVSASFIITGDRSLALPPGAQHIDRESDGTLRYHGGELPLRDDLAERAQTLAQRAIDEIQGLHGYIGVDLILGQTADDDQVIEINPRLTMSYLALTQMCQSNLAAAMLGSRKPLRWWMGACSFDAAGRIISLDAVSPEDRV